MGGCVGWVDGAAEVDLEAEEVERCWKAKRSRTEVQVLHLGSVLVSAWLRWLGCGEGDLVEDDCKEGECGEDIRLAVLV